MKKSKKPDLKVVQLHQEVRMCGAWTFVHPCGGGKIIIVSDDEELMAERAIFLLECAKTSLILGLPGYEDPHGDVA